MKTKQKKKSKEERERSNHWWKYRNDDAQEFLRKVKQQKKISERTGE